MTTDKEAAAAWRTLAEKADEQGLTRLAIERRKIADTIDPPKPTYADGTIAWVTYTHAIEDGHPYQALAQYDADENEWVMERTPAGADCTVVGDNVTKVEPLRVLGDNEIALPVVTKVAGQLRDDADQLDASNGYGNPSAAVLRAYAEAVDDAQRAEAGGHMCADVPCRCSAEAGAR